MRITPTHARILESRIERRLAAIRAERIALLGAGHFTRALLGSRDDPGSFAGARVTGIIDETPDRLEATLLGIPIVRSADDAPCDAVVVATPMHEPAILRRASHGALGDRPVIGMHTVTDPDELGVDTLLLPETAWFGLDLPGLLEQSGRSCTIVGASGLPGFDQTDLAGFWDDNDATPADSITWAGLDLFALVRGSAACLLGRAKVDPVADRPALIPLIDETIRIYESAIRCFQMARAPGAVVVANGLLHHQRAVAEAALRCGKRAIAIESSCFPGLCHLEPGSAQTGARVAMGRSVRDRLEARIFSPAQRERTTKFLRDRNPHTEHRNDSASQPPPAPTGAIREQLRIPVGDRVLLLLGQVCTDTTLVYDAPIINDITELARRAAQVVARTPGWTLIIKPHPKEATGADPIAARPYTLGAYDRLVNDRILASPNVRLTGPTEHNVYALMRLADAGLAINSQSALEMTAMFARPVCLVGRAAFAGAGFTRDVAHTSAFESTLLDLLTNPVLTRAQHDRALQYVDHAVFENLIPADVRTPAQALARDNEAVRILLGARETTETARLIEHKESTTRAAV